jgi:hypothetical protein
MCNQFIKIHYTVIKVSLVLLNLKKLLRINLDRKMQIALHNLAKMQQKCH